MRRFLSLLMGLHECAGTAEVRKQYQRVITALMAAQVDCSPDQARRYETAIDKLSIAFEKAKKQLNSNDEMHGSVTGTGVLLGEILIDAGAITAGQLEAALETQAKMKPPLPIGRILVARKIITWDQLAYYLKLQDLLQLPTFHKQRLSRQLLELGLASKSELETAELDCDTTGYSMFHVIERRSWISPAILAVITGAENVERPTVQMERPAVKAPAPASTPAPAPAPAPGPAPAPAPAPVMDKSARASSMRKLMSAPNVFEC